MICIIDTAVSYIVLAISWKQLDQVAALKRAAAASYLDDRLMADIDWPLVFHWKRRPRTVNK